MRRLVLLVLGGLVLGTSTNLHAQEFRFGLNGEAILSWMVSDDENVEAKGLVPGFSYGLWADYFFAANYGVATGLRVSHFGGLVKYNNAPFYIRKKKDTVIALPGTQLRYSLQYVEIPLTLKFRTNEIGYLTYFGQFGFVPGILWKAKVKTKDIADLEESTRIYDMNFFNASLIIGLGFEYNLAANTSLLVRLSYNGGFTDVTRHKIVFTDEDNASVRINSIRLTVGILF